jgi:hypothetical protein
MLRHWFRLPAHTLLSAKGTTKGYKKETEQKCENIVDRAEMATGVPDPWISIKKATELDRSKSKILNYELMECKK